MIDIHSHILWGVDDGADSELTSQTLLSQYVEQGVDCVVCTPHQNKILRRPETIQRVFSDLKEMAKDLPINLYLGAEILYYVGMAKDLARGELLTMAGSDYLLVEFPVICNVDTVCDAIYELTIANYKPIVAHIERYADLTKDDYFAVKEAGALIQVNAGSFNAKSRLKTVKYLLKNGLVDFVASDCHDAQHRNVNFAQAKELVKKKFPEQYDKLFNRKFN